MQRAGGALNTTIAAPLTKLQRKTRRRGMGEGKQGKIKKRAPQRGSHVEGPKRYHL